MEIKDMTKEQAIEIAMMAYGHDDWIRSDFKFEYVPYDPPSIKNSFDDSPESVYVKFEGVSFGDKIDLYRLFIYSNLNITLDIFRTDPIKIISVGFSNQFLIFKKLQEWGIEPVEK